jgi:DNA polymerase-3 subunit alpha
MRFETHCHSHFSNIRLIDSICKPKDLITTAAELGYSGITLTDHEALCGHVEWLELEKELKKSNTIPQDFVCALGNEIYLTETREPSQKYWHFILIAKNTEGHRALRELSSQAWLNSYRHRGMERVPTLKTELEAIVKKYPNSLIATNACLGGELGGLVLRLVEEENKGSSEEVISIKQEIDSFIQFCINLFGDDFYIEIAPGRSKDQLLFNERIKSIANYYQLPMIIATDAHYLTEKDREIHKSFLNSKDGDREVDSFYHDAHLMSDEAAYERVKEFYSVEEFSTMCDNSLKIMSKITGYEIFHKPIIPEVSIEDVPRKLLSELSEYPHLQGLRNSENNQERRWAAECLSSLKNKGIYDEVHLQRLELEADVISHISNALGNCLFAYFNTFQHYIDLFWDCGSIVGPGRGSAGSFLSNYLLGMTQLDPVEWNLPYFRFLNKDRAELPDIDVDLAPSKRPLILKKIREERGELNVIQVATFGTESAKAAIACGCRGYRSKDFPQGIDVDVAQYLASLVPVERGITWSFKDCLEGNEEKERQPIRELITQINQYPGLKEIIYGIEGLVCRRGQHPSGVMMYNNSPYETTALMRSPNGDITTQFDLHKSEALGDTKFDFLVTDICDKLSVALDLLSQDNYFPDCSSKREIYNKYLHPQVINLTEPRLWEALANGEVQDVFQFNTEIGIQTAKAIKPKNPAEMTSANALLRLAAPEGQERPLERYLRFKNDVSLWYQEMTDFGLTKQEQSVLEPYYLRDYGVPASQEQLMLMVMDKNISNFTLAESNTTRKVLAKKQVKKIPEIKQKFLSQCPSEKLGEYCWMTMMLPQMSYSFSEVHALVYSFIGIQTLVMATKFPSIYWNTACLIVNSQSIQDKQEDEEEIEAAEEEVRELDEDNDDDDDDNETEGSSQDDKKKKKVKAMNYGKVAAAIGKIKSTGVIVTPPDINKSTFTFSPDVESNTIRYGLSGITKVGEELVKTIMGGRPYTSLSDFMSRIKINKPQMVNLIKSGAFDCFGDRQKIMREYIDAISDVKKRITLQNMKMLIDFGLIPDEFDLERRVFNFNKYIKKMKIDGTYYGLDEIGFNFYSAYFDIDKLEPCENTESGFKIKQIVWDNYYQKHMDVIRPFVQKNAAELLVAVNNQLTADTWNKYCTGSVSKWEMDSVSFYSHEHELSDVDMERYELVDFFDLPESPVVDRVIPIKGKQVPILKLFRICGTVLDRDKAKKTVTLLTTSGVVTVKIFGGVFAAYDKQISERGADGKKHVIRKSEFARGNKIIVIGVRDGDSFRAKKYSRTPHHLVETIVGVNSDGTIIIDNRQDLEE